MVAVVFLSIVYICECSACVLRSKNDSPESVLSCHLVASEDGAWTQAPLYPLSYLSGPLGSVFLS